MVVVSLEDIEERRRSKMYSTSTAHERQRSRTEALMAAEKLGRGTTGKRPVGNRRTGVRAETLNAGIIARSPGSRIVPVDFVKAVYANRTGQE
jgi:hypothetical protein